MSIRPFTAAKAAPSIWESPNLKDVSRKPLSPELLEELNWKNDPFIEVLEEFEKGNDIEAKRFIEFFAKYENRRVKKKPADENENELWEQIKGKFDLDDYQSMTMRECMAYILDEIEPVSEDDLHEAFKVFDTEETGMVKLSTLKMIMEDYGPLGSTLNEEQVIRLLGMFQIEYENVDISKNREVTEHKSKKKSTKKTNKHIVDETTGEVLRQVSKEKEKEKEVVEEVKYVEIPEISRGQRHIRYVKDVDVDYRIFAKKIIELINHQETTLWGDKD